MRVFVRAANGRDANNFAEWFYTMPSCSESIFQFPETYTLCAFTKGKILAYGVVSFGHGVQILSRIVSNPEGTDLEKALASSEITKAVITIGYINNLHEIYFVGDHSGTNRIAEHVFEEVPYEVYSSFFNKSTYPVYRLVLRDLE